MPEIKRTEEIEHLIIAAKSSLETVRGRWQDICRAGGIDVELVYRIMNGRASRHVKSSELKKIIKECRKYYKLYGEKI